MSDKIPGLAIMSAMKANIIENRGPYMRLALYVFVAFGNGLLEKLGALTAEKVASMHWWDWTVLYGSPIVAAAVVWRAFLDSSLERVKNDNQNDSQNPPAGDQP